MATISVLTHPSAAYSGRTIRNARFSDVTVAFACDFRTAGETLTAQSAGQDKLVQISLKTLSAPKAAMRIAEHMRHSNHCIGKRSVVNIAGNGMYTLTNYGWTQESINSAIDAVFHYLKKLVPIGKVVSGGQTGVDIAGVVAAFHHGYPVEVLMPQKCRQRNQDGQEMYSAPEAIESTIRSYAALLS